MHKKGQPCLCLNCRLTRAEEKISSLEELLQNVATSEHIKGSTQSQDAQTKKEMNPTLRIRFHEP